MHGDHHGPVVIGVEHSIARLGDLDPLATAEHGVALREGIKIFALGGVDDTNAFERDIELGGRKLHLGAIAQQDGRTQAQRIILSRRLQNARLRAFRKYDPLRVALELFDDVANETHGELTSGAGVKAQLAFRRQVRMEVAGRSSADWQSAPRSKGRPPLPISPSGSRTWCGTFRGPGTGFRRDYR